MASKVSSERVRDLDALDCVRTQWNRLSVALQGSQLQESADPEFCRKQTRLILLLSASRSGASWFAELCASSTRLCSLPGEIDPFLLLTLGPPDLAVGESDRLEAYHATPSVSEALSQYLHQFAGNQSCSQDSRLTSLRRFQIAMRTLVQWPELREQMDGVQGAIRETFEQTEGLSREERMTLYLLRLKQLLPCVNPYFYDLDPKLVGKYFPDEPIPMGPPTETTVIEEPPFICESPWACALDGGAPDRPLLLKSPSNAYRLGFLRALFPNAEITALHLMRDPAASVTGLMSGWLHHGFFKHRMPGGTLHIERYLQPDQPWTSEWWKFDLPPNWNRYTRCPLEEVCTFQWVSANEHILRWVKRNTADIHYVQTSLHRLKSDLKGEISRVFSELGLRPDAGLLNAVALNRRTMVSYGVSPPIRSELQRLAASATDCVRVRNILDAFADVAPGLSVEIA